VNSRHFVKARTGVIGKSRGGLTTKILALADALGNLVRFMPLPGQRFHAGDAPPLIKALTFGARIFNKAFDSNKIIADLKEHARFITEMR
jgi:hypothetical protein